ncbi:MAG: hypothetical protein M3116_06035 [Actinomycetota bacterium]|nr:hypothetical protein [Actinomycetota bacterium]
MSIPDMTDVSDIGMFFIISVAALIWTAPFRVAVGRGAAEGERRRLSIPG